MGKMHAARPSIALTPHSGFSSSVFTNGVVEEEALYAGVPPNNDCT
jgi:hypothetical protein